MENTPQPYKIAANGKLDLGIVFYIGGLILALVGLLSTIGYKGDKQKEQPIGKNKMRRKSIS